MKHAKQTWNAKAYLGGSVFLGHGKPHFHQGDSKPSPRPRNCPEGVHAGTWAAGDLRPCRNGGTLRDKKCKISELLEIPVLMNDFKAT